MACRVVTAFSTPVQARLPGRFIVLAATALPGLADVTFSDGTFNPSDWQVVELYSGADGSYRTTQHQFSGNPGAFRQIDITVNAGPTAISANAWGAQFLAGATYNPQAMVPIASIDYSEDAIRLGGVAVGDEREQKPALKTMVLPSRC